MSFHRFPGLLDHSRLQQAWAARHVSTHNDGVVDAKYLAGVPTSTVQIGQRLTLTEQAFQQAVTDTETLCPALADIAS